MQLLPPEKLLSITAHPDDTEMHHAGLLARAKLPLAMVATRGEATTLNFTQTPRELLVEQRHEESKKAMAFYGFKGIWLDLPDGELARPEHVENLAQNIVDTSLKHEVDALVSMGDDGYCDHLDHKATHWSALLAQDILAHEHGRAVPLYALDSRNGQFRVPVDRQSKMAGFAFHASQFLAKDGKIDEDFWKEQRSATYEPLLHEETYRVIRPSTSLRSFLARKQKPQQHWQVTG